MSRIKAMAALYRDCAVVAFAMSATSTLVVLAFEDDPNIDKKGLVYIAGFSVFLVSVGIALLGKAKAAQDD